MKKQFFFKLRAKQNYKIELSVNFFAPGSFLLFRNRYVGIIQLKKKQKQLLELLRHLLHCYQVS